MKVTASSGFKCEINEDILNDWRLTKAIVKSHSNDTEERSKAAVDMVSLIMRENEDTFYNFLADKNNGIVTEQMVVDDLGSIISQLKKLKN